MAATDRIGGERRGSSGAAALEEISRSRSEPAIRLERARKLLAYRESRSFLRWGVP
jgi:hypothetical protein